jgi:Lrp/AsnC family transcriptional regulator for asnA, asnC and gidA
MDKLDLLILKELTEDAQMPFSKIAINLGISTDTVIKRYNKMIRRNILLNSHISFDPKKIGYDSAVFLFIRVEPNKDRQEVFASLKEIKSVLAIVSITGDFNIFVDAAIRDLGEVKDLINQVNGIMGVDRVEFILSDDFHLFTEDYHNELVSKILKNV